MNDSTRRKELTGLILGAGKEPPAPGAGTSPPPRSLLTDEDGTRVLDWILAAFRQAGIEHITFVGGYQIDMIGQRYPELDYIYNPAWEFTGVLESLYHARHVLDGPVVITYGDVVFHGTAVKKLIDGALEGITIAIDKDYSADPGQFSRIRKNLVTGAPENIIEIGFLPSDTDILGEFTGLCHLSAKVSAEAQVFFENIYPVRVGSPFQQSKDIKYAYLTDLLRHLNAQGHGIRGVDIAGDWVEVDEASDLARFVMGSKSETLQNLQPVLKKAEFVKQIVYTVGEWKTDPEAVLASIAESFSPDRVAVRSSALAEDSWTESLAGVFESVLNINPKDKHSTRQAIQRVLDSYSAREPETNDQNQILVQHMVKNVTVSGVVLTRIVATGAPYYLLNFDDQTGSTNTVTGGNARHQLRTILVSRDYDSTPEDTTIATILEFVREIEHVLGTSTLEIEFALDKDGKIYLLQARPLAAIPKPTLFKDELVAGYVRQVKQYLANRLSPSPILLGDSTIFADMPDWNPAEMIGTNPRTLALSLYNDLIMKSVWREARGAMGYRNPAPAMLMVTLGGHPYVDVRASFNNLIPSTLPEELARKLVNHYLSRLRENPILHDKVEFEICITCLGFNFEFQSTRLSEAGFDEGELVVLREALFTITDKIVGGELAPISEQMEKIETLQKRGWTSEGDISIDEIPSRVTAMLDDAANLGTHPFAILAREAFIANSLLRSLAAKGIISPDEVAGFQSSITSVATDLVRDMNVLADGSEDKEKFLEKYGHLRPGTYDITSPRYAADPDRYFPKSMMNTQNDKDSFAEPFVFSQNKVDAMQIEIDRVGFSFSAATMLAFMREAIANREYSKFGFTKVVSDILELIARLGSQCGFNREQMSFIDIGTIRQISTIIEPEPIERILADEINRRQRIYEQTHLIHLPHIITKPDDIEVMELLASRPNFVTLEKVTAEIIKVDHDTDPHDLKGKIVLIEGADPGFDWIFAHSIAGLITMYGGAASHMTIRASEFNIPAAIGCGEVLFRQIEQKKVIDLNCAEKYVRTP